MNTRLTELHTRRYLRRLLRQTNTDSSMEAVVLLGSTARSARIESVSDVDILIVGQGQPPRPPLGVQLSVMSAKELAERAGHGDDFAQWALRHGVPLAGQELWRRLRENVLKDADWPDPAVSLDRAEGPLRHAESLWGMGDLDAAREEARYAMSHIARAELLAARVFPLSRPELPAQLWEVGNRELAEVLERLLRTDSFTSDDIEEALELARKCLARLSSSDGSRG